MGLISTTRLAEVPNVDAPSPLEGSSVPRAVLAGAFAIAVVVCWILPARNPLWRDETGTYWIVKDGITDVISRSYYWTNWSPYYLIEWLAVHVGGKSEFVMRFPSFAATCLAAFLIYRLGTRLWDRETGVLGALVFTVMPDVAFAAADARPYAFVLAVLCGYAWAIFRWIDTGRLRHAIAAVLLAVLTAYGHILLSLGLVVPALYAVWNRPKSPQPLIMSALAAVLSVPLVFQLRDYMAMSTTHIVAGTPTLSDFWPALASDQFLATIGAGVLLAFVALPRIHLHWGISRAATLFLFAWIAFPPATLFVLGRAGLIEVFVGRYMLSAAIPQAILFGGFVRAVAPARARSLVVETLVVVSVGAFFFSAKSFHGEGWKDAIAAIRMEMGTSNLPLLMSSPFVEADTAENVNDPKLKDVLYAPILIYRTPGRLIRLPFPYDEKYLDQVVDSDLKKEKAFVLLTADLPVPHWLDHRLADRGVESTVVGEYRGWRVYRYRMTR